MSFVPIQETGNEKIQKVVDANLSMDNSDSDVAVVLEQGGQNIQYNPLLSVSHSQTNTTFNLNNIAQTTARSTKMWVNIPVVKVALTIRNNSAAPVVAIGSSNLGWKSRCYNRSVSSIQHKINQASYNLQTNQILSEIARLNVDPEKEGDDLNVMPDEIDSYAAATGSSLNPLESVSTANQSKYNWKPRTNNLTLDTVNYPTTSYTIPALTTATIYLTGSIYEELVSVFNNCSGGVQETPAMFGIQGENIQINYVSDLFNNMIAYYNINGCTLLSGSVNIAYQTAITLQLKYITPLPSMISMIPMNQVYRYPDYNVFVNQIAPSVVGGASTGNFTSPVVSLSTIPDRILIYCKESVASASCSVPDKYLAVQNLQVSFNNSNYNFSGAQVDDFYNISRRNGLQMSRSCFRQDLLNDRCQINGNLYGSGGPIVIRPSFDLGLAENMSTGVGGRFTLQITGSFVNNTQTTFNNVQLYVVAVNVGVLMRNGTEYMNYLLNVNENSLLNARELPAISQAVLDNEPKSDGFQGAGGLRSYLRKAHNMKNKYHAVSNLLKSRGGIALGGESMGGRSRIY
jgi:hypothetical protein